tara:strand:- start:202 stop:942 length:741 start_codon:yes stop_codon:yes gene_type:complete
MKVNETHLMLEGWSRIPETNGVVVKRLSRLIDTYKKIPIRFRTTFYDGNEDDCYGNKKKKIRVTWSIAGENPDKLGEEKVVGKDSAESIRKFCLSIRSAGEVVQELDVVDESFCFTSDISKNRKDIVDPHGHMTWSLNSKKHLICFDYIISDCQEMIHIQSVIDYKSGGGAFLHLDEFQSKTVSIPDAVSCASEIVNEAYEHLDHIDPQSYFFSGNTDEFIKSIESQVNIINDLKSKSISIYGGNQ